MSPLGKCSASLEKSVSHLVHGIACCKSHASELKNWMSKSSKKKKSHVGVELRAGGDPYRSEKPRWSASDTGNGQKMLRHSVSPKGVLF